MSLDAIVASITALIVISGGVYVTVHEVRRRERRTTAREIDELVKRVEALQHLLLEQREYIYRVAMTLADHGIEVPQPPDPSFDENEYPRH